MYNDNKELVCSILKLIIVQHFSSLVVCSLKQEADESLNFEEQILEAAKSIAAATSALVKAASAAQRELVAQGKVCENQQKNWYVHLNISEIPQIKLIIISIKEFSNIHS